MLRSAPILLIAALFLAACTWLTSWRDPEPSAVSGFEEAREAAERGPTRVIALLVAPDGATPAQMGDVQAAAVAAFADMGIVRAEALTETWPLIVAEVTADDLDRMSDSGRIASVMLDRLTFTQLAQSVPLVGGPEIARLGARGGGQAIAILDTGVEANHPFLGGRVVEEACFSSTVASQGARTVCPSQMSSQIGRGAAAPCSANGCDHGTHVAGIAAGRGASFTGVAPDADIIAIQVFSQFTDRRGGPRPCSSSGQRSPCVASFTSDQIRALDHVLRLSARREVAAVNMSLGGGRSTAACDSDVTAAVIEDLLEAQVATVIAAGNNGFGDAVSRPGCISAAITVGATGKDDSVARFSNRSALLDLYAPGVGINSSVARGRFAAYSGTSMAAPHVAGAFAALRSARPQASVGEIERALESTGVAIAGVPRIALPAALAALPQTQPQPAPPRAAAAAAAPAAEAALAELAALPQDAPVRVIATAAAGDAVALENAARAAGAAHVERLGTRDLVVIEATPSQLTTLVQSGAMAAMQVDATARPQ